MAQRNKIYQAWAAQSISGSTAGFIHTWPAVTERTSGSIWRDV